jgi:adenine specific DNA methylase Mod
MSDTIKLDKLEPIKGFPELRWAGKRPLSHVRYFPAQLRESYGDTEDSGWRNKIFWGDNLYVLGHLIKDLREQVSLIYIDPPFDSKAEYKKKIKAAGKTAESDINSFEEKQYRDIWTNDGYLQFMYDRLILAKQLLTADGVICIHCDWHKSHHLRSLLDEVFGPENFVNEIVWHYYNKMQGNVNRFASDHDSILVYSKGSDYKFNRLREIRKEPVKQIKRVWDPETQSLKNAKDDNGNVVYINSTHKTIDDVWRLPMLQPAGKTEVLDYPTKKPECLLERIILGVCLLNLWDKMGFFKLTS